MNNSESDGPWMWFNWTQVDDDGDVTSGANNETSVVSLDWDDWDASLWTPEQRRMLERGAIPREVHITLGVLLALIVLFGVAANSTILYVFSRCWPFIVSFIFISNAIGRYSPVFFLCFVCLFCFLAFLSKKDVSCGFHIIKSQKTLLLYIPHYTYTHNRISLVVLRWITSSHCKSLSQKPLRQYN
jgi:hypothetical protein